MVAREAGHSFLFLVFFFFNGPDFLVFFTFMTLPHFRTEASHPHSKTDVLPSIFDNLGTLAGSFSEFLGMSVGCHGREVWT